MNQEKKLYPSSFNPLFNKPNRPLPKEIAVIGAGTIGPDIGYYIKNALPGIKLYLVDVVEEPLSKAKKRFSDGSVDIPEITIPDEPMSDKLALSKEAVSTAVKTIQDGAATHSYIEAIEIGYKGFAEVACTDAAKEGTSAFLEKRRPVYKK
jgi:threonine dehydrogenase-like Zn-dependent dehydrogenase